MSMIRFSQSGGEGLTHSRSPSVVVHAESSWRSTSSAELLRNRSWTRRTRTKVRHPFLPLPLPILLVLAAPTARRSAARWLYASSAACPRTQAEATGAPALQSFYKSRVTSFMVEGQLRRKITRRRKYLSNNAIAREVPSEITLWAPWKTSSPWGRPRLRSPRSCWCGNSNFSPPSRSPAALAKPARFSSVRAD